MGEDTEYEEGPRIDPAEAKLKFDAGTALFVDVRGRHSFERARIPGARWLTVRGFQADPGALPRERAIIFY
jgi:rhodanese-related sulfurtransferase